MAVDGRHVYWTNTGTNSNSIGRANLDGSGVDQSFITGANDPHGVAVDGQHVYWTNAGRDAIGRANLDGSGVDQSFITGADFPEGLAVDGQHVYWGNALNGTIGRANLDGSGVDQRFITGANGPGGVAVDSMRVPVRISAMHAAPLRPGCAVEVGRDERELVALSADATCRHLRLTLHGTIQTGGHRAPCAGGTVTVSYKVKLPRGRASGSDRAIVQNGRWRISLVLPGVNLDPTPPNYLITVHYSGDRTIKQASTSRRVRLESERAGLHP